MGIFHASAEAQPIIPSVDEELSRRLASVVDLLEVEDWDRAIDVLESIHIAGDANVVRIDEQLYLNAAEYARYLLTQLPEAAITRYRERFEVRAEELWQDAEATGDTASLETILREAFLTRTSERAIDRLAERALQAGQFSKAWSLWLMLVPPVQTDALLVRYPDPTFPPEDLLAKLVLCRILSGDLVAAREELSVYRERYPDAEGTLAGQRDTWVSLLETLLSNMRESDSETLSARNMPPLTLDIGASYWSLPVQSDPFNAPRTGLSDHPMVWNNIVFWNTGSAIMGYHLQTGLGAWMTDPPGSLEDWQLQGQLYPTRIDRFNFQPDRPVHGKTGESLTIHDGRLYARLGGPITGYAADETRVQPSRLICLDLANRQGQLVWEFEATKLDRDLRLEGPPQVGDRHLWILARRGLTPSELHLICLNRADGQFLWNRHLCSNSARVPEGSNLASSLELVHYDQRLFVSTELGAVAAFHARDGRPIWYRAYPRVFETTEAITTERLSSPLVIAGDRLLVSPTDSEELIALEINTGERLWNIPRDRDLQLWGTAGAHLFLSGSALEARRLTDGGLTWRFHSQDPILHGQGRGIVTRDAVWWPTPTELLIFKNETGRLIRRVDLYHMRGIQGGNLASSAEGLIIAGPQRLTSLSPWGERPNDKLGGESVR